MSDKPPPHLSVESLIKQLEEANYYKTNKDEYGKWANSLIQGYEVAVANLRELLSNKIITDPEAIKEVYRAGAKDNFDFCGLPSEFPVYVNENLATYLKEHFNIDVK